VLRHHQVGQAQPAKTPQIVVPDHSPSRARCLRNGIGTRDCSRTFANVRERPHAEEYRVNVGISMHSRLRCAFGLATASFVGIGIAHANPVTAEALFSEGRRLLLEGDYEQAILKLAESQAQDPASGTLINLALAHERMGRIATAWALYEQAAILARRDGRTDRRATAEAKRAELEPKVPRLTFRAERPIPGLTISWGSAGIGAAALGSPIPVDAGEYRIVASAPGHDLWTTTIRVREGERLGVEIPDLPTIPQQFDSAQATGGKRSPAPSRQSELERAPVAPSQGSALALLLGASGLASVGIGVGFGVHALNKYSEAERGCPSHKGCDAHSLGAWHSAETSAWVSNIGIGVGSAACVTGLWLLWRADKSANSRTAVVPVPLSGGAGLLLRGAL
jgi:hypothetical protein